jgi:hypothetical protein
MKHYTIDNCPAHIRNYVFQSEEYKKLQDELTRLDMFKKFFDVRLYNIILSKYIWQGRVPNSYYNTSHGPRTWKPPRPWYDTDKKLPWGVRYSKPKNPFIGLRPPSVGTAKDPMGRKIASSSIRPTPLMYVATVLAKASLACAAVM